MTVFDTGISTLHNDRNLSVSATYCPKNGAEVTLRAIKLSRGHTESNLFTTGMSAPADVAEVRVADVAEPQEGDVLKIGTERFRVKKPEYDGERLTWRLDLARIG